MMFHFPTKGTPIKLYTAARDEKYIESVRMDKRRKHYIKDNFNSLHHVKVIDEGVQNTQM